MISTEISCSLSLPGGPHLSLIAMPVPSLMFLLATLLLISLVLNVLNVKAPFRLGSTGKDEAEVRPAIFYVVEDIVAVDGNGGVEYRTQFNLRYASSPIFRRMLFRLSMVWMLVFYFIGTLLAILISIMSSNGEDAQMIALGISWAGPFVIGGMLAWGTTIYVQECLRKERKEEIITENDERRPLLRS